MSLETTTRRKYLLDKAMALVNAIEINDEFSRELEDEFFSIWADKYDKQLFNLLSLAIRTIKGKENFIAAESTAIDLGKFETDKAIGMVELAERFEFKL
jgi:hypothetical protein